MSDPRLADPLGEVYLVMYEPEESLSGYTNVYHILCVARMPRHMMDDVWAALYERWREAGHYRVSGIYFRHQPQSPVERQAIDIEGKTTEEAVAALVPDYTKSEAWE